MPLISPKALEHRVLLLSGSEDVLRREALAEIREQLGDDDGFDTESFVAGEIDAQNWMASVGTLPFLAQRRTVFVRHLLRLDAKDTLAVIEASMAALPASSLLVLVADDEPGDDDRQKTLDKRRSAWETAIKKLRGFVFEPKTDTKELHRMVKDRLAESGLTLSEKALTSLIEMTGGGLGRALEEADKLRLYVEPGAIVQAADVQAVVVPSRDWNVYKLVDAIVSGQLSQAMRQLRNLIGSSNKADSAAFQQIFPTLSSQFKLIWQARLCQEAKCDPQNPNDAVRSMLPMKGEISKEREWRIRPAVFAAKRLNLVRLTHCLGVLAEADARMKGQGASFSAIETLEQTVMRLVSIASEKA